MKKAAERFQRSDDDFAELQRQVDEAKAIFEALVSGQIDSVTEPAGPVLLRKAQEALRVSEERYRLIVENAFDGIWLIDSDGRTTFANPRIAELLGYEPSEMLGKSPYDFMDDEARRIAESSLRKRGRGIHKLQEFKFRRKDG